MEAHHDHSIPEFDGMGDDEVLIARTEESEDGPVENEDWHARRAVAEFISRRTVETLLIFWIGRDPVRRTLFENRIRFETFPEAVQVMELSEHELEQWKRALSTRQRRATFRRLECPTLEDAWDLARHHWRREPLLKTYDLLRSMRRVVNEMRFLLEREAPATHAIIFGQGEADDLWDVPEVATGFRAIAEHARRNDPTLPRLIDRADKPTALGWKLLAEARFLLLGQAEFHRLTQAA